MISERTLFSSENSCSADCSATVDTGFGIEDVCCSTTSGDLLSALTITAEDCLEQLRKTNPAIVEREGADFILATFREALNHKFGALGAKLARRGNDGRLETSCSVACLL